MSKTCVKRYIRLTEQGIMNMPAEEKAGMFLWRSLMAKLERHLKADIGTLLGYLDHQILSGSISASLEDSSSFRCDGFRCEVRVYERFSWLGGNRLSLSITVLGTPEGTVHLSAIASGGSQAMFYKINTLGEENFLEEFRRILDSYQNY